VLLIFVRVYLDEEQMNYKVMTFSLAIICILHNCPISTEYKQLRRSGAGAHEVTPSYRHIS
jgi:hypothetical protein